MRILFSLVFLALLMSCKQDIGKKRTVSGYDYEKVAAGSGEKSVAGQYAKVSLAIVGDDGVALQENNDPSNYPIFQIPVASEGPQNNPLMDVLLGASVGDSFVITVPMDSLQINEPSFAHLKEIYYRVGVKEIMTEEAYNTYIDGVRAEKEAAANVVKARLPEVESLVKSTLADYKSGKLQTTTTASGMKYFIHEEGSGAVANQGDLANVHYYGTLLDGTMFDNSIARGSAFQFKAGTGSVIQGWDEAITTFKKGTKASIFLPADLAYGETGSGGKIPPGAELMFYIEIQE